jgi:hypothetical protein
MALVKGTNSYLTVEEADAYLQERVNSAAWFTATESLKETALITSTRIVDCYSFLGTAIGDDLAFPRDGMYFEPKLGKYVSLEAVPKRILQATSELAFYLIVNPTSQEAKSSVESLEVDVIKLINIKTPSSVPNGFYSLLQPLLVKGSDSWWRAN